MNETHIFELKSIFCFSFIPANQFFVCVCFLDFVLTMNNKLLPNNHWNPKKSELLLFSFGMLVAFWFDARFWYWDAMGQNALFEFFFAHEFCGHFRSEFLLCEEENIFSNLSLSLALSIHTFPPLVYCILSFALALYTIKPFSHSNNNKLLRAKRCLN